MAIGYTYRDILGMKHGKLSHLTVAKTLLTVLLTITHLPLEGHDDEVQHGWIHTLDALLNHMVPILIPDALQDVAIEFIDYLRLVQAEEGGVE